jgi:Mrp family chromosome partitioning ATPase
LKIITSGPIPPNPTELLSSNEMKNLLQFLRGNFRHVIIDSPPAISFTDAAILSTWLTALFWWQWRAKALFI